MTHSKVNHMFWELMYYHVWDVCAKSALTQYDNTCKCLLNLIICKCWRITPPLVLKARC